jgi:hypothetical protein
LEECGTVVGFGDMAELVSDDVIDGVDRSFNKAKIEK